MPKQIQLFIIVTTNLLITLCSCSFFIPQGNRIQDPHSPIYCIDRDNDGYGVAAEKGPDADDQDPNVNTSSSIITKYGSLRSFLTKIGYNPKNIYFISVNGNDSFADGSEGKPFGSFEKAKSKVSPGDMIIYRKGDYAPGVGYNKFRITADGLNGTQENPIVIMSYPGEKVIINSSYSAITLGTESKKTSYIIVDGFTCTWDGEASNGIEFYFSNNITIRNIDISHFARGIFAFQDLHNILIENVVSHDAYSCSSGTHGIYLGEHGAETTNSDIIVRGCILYRNGRHGLQHNGRLERLTMENNIIHSNFLGGISLINGIKDGIFRNNLIFNNEKQAIVLYVYESNGIENPNTNNLFINNTLWVGKYHSLESNQDTPEGFAAVTININDGTGAEQKSDPENYIMKGNVFRNNCIVTCNGPAFDFGELTHLPYTTIENNVIYKTGSHPDLIMYSPKTDGTHNDIQGSYWWNFETFSNKTPLIKNNILSNPLFVDVAYEYARTPEKFNFIPITGSIVKNYGISLRAPDKDINNVSRDSKPDAGCYEIR